MKKIKIGIITLFGNFNYGNRLQNIAVQEFLNSLGFESESIYLSNMYDKSIKIRAKNSLKFFLALFFKKYKRSFKFWKFTKNNIKFRTVNSKQEYKIIEKEYDYFVVGSDQVWNPEFFVEPYEELLLFTDSRKKIAFSVSFGVEKIEKEQVSIMKEGIESFKNISVREEEGVKILKEEFNKESICLIDPTMAVPKEFWDSRVENNKISSNYILLYYLGEISEEYKSFIKGLEDKYKYKIINIMDKKSKYYTADPFEFVNLIKNAKLVLTDSFHGSVFSIIYHIPLVIFERIDQFNSMNSRIQTLVNKFKIEDRLYKNINYNNIFNNKYEHYDLVIQSEREKVSDYIKNAIKQ